MRKGAAHWPTNSAQSSLPLSFKIADAAIEPRARPKNKLAGAWEVCRSIAPVNRSSLLCPRSTLVSILDISCCRTLRSLDNVLQQPGAKVNRKLLSNTGIFYAKVRQRTGNRNSLRYSLAHPRLDLLS